MHYTIKDQNLFCSIQKNLVSSNVKELVESAKMILDENINSIQHVTLDINSVSQIDSIGVTFLIGIYKSIKAYDIDLELINAHKNLYDLLIIMKLDKIMTIKMREE